MIRALRQQILNAGRRFAWVLLLPLCASSDGFVKYKYHAHQMEIQGTSNFQPWTVNVNELGLHANLRINEAGNISLVGPSAMAIRAGSIVAARHSLMDIKIFKALQGDDHPYLTFKLTKVNTQAFPNKVTFIKGEGVLKVAGINHTVPVGLYARELPNGDIEMWGGQVVDVRSLSIRPPSAFWGLYYYKPVISLTFSIILRKER